MKFRKFLRTPFTEHLRWLLLERVCKGTSLVKILTPCLIYLESITDAPEKWPLSKIMNKRDCWNVFVSLVLINTFFFSEICSSCDPQPTTPRFKKGKAFQSKIKEILRATGNNRDLMVLTRKSAKVNKRCTCSLFNFTNNKLTW